MNNSGKYWRTSSSHEASNLKRHLRKYIGEKPFKCDQCNYSTKHSFALKTHRLVHTGEKPYHCDYCNMSFRQTGHLHKHMRKIHSAKANVNMNNSGKYWQTISSSVSTHYIISSAKLPWLLIVEKMLMTMITAMMTWAPGGVETIGRRLRPKVPDPSTPRPATTLLPCYCPPTLLLVSDPIWTDFFLSPFSQILVREMDFLLIWWTFTNEFCVVKILSSGNIFISKPQDHVGIDQYHRSSLTFSLKN